MYYFRKCIKKNELYIKYYIVLDENVLPSNTDERLKIVSNVFCNIWKNNIDTHRFVVNEEISDFSPVLLEEDFITPNPLLIWSSICRLFLTYPSYDITPKNSENLKLLYELLEHIGQGDEELIKHPPPMTVMEDFWNLQEERDNHIVSKIIPEILLLSQMFQLLEDRHLEYGFNQEKYYYNY